MSGAIVDFAGRGSTYARALRRATEGTGIPTRTASESTAAVLDRVRDGGLTGAVLTAPELSRLVPGVSWSELRLWGDRCAARERWQAWAQAHAGAEGGMRGLVVVAVFDGGERHLVVRRGVQVPTDSLTGMRVRVMPGSAIAHWVRAMDGEPVELAAVQLSRAWRQGEIDACERSWSNIEDYGLRELMGAVVRTSHAVALAFVVVSERAAAAELPTARTEGARRSRLPERLADAARWQSRAYRVCDARAERSLAAADVRIVEPEGSAWAGAHTRAGALLRQRVAAPS